MTLMRTELVVEVKQGGCCDGAGDKRQAKILAAAREGSCAVGNPAL